MKQKIFSISFMVVLILMAIIISGCSTADINNDDSDNDGNNGGNNGDDENLYIGKAYQGGIIAYILQSGDTGYVAGETHGLIASKEDLSTKMGWWNEDYITTRATGATLGTGRANTTAIVKAHGSAIKYAAKICDDYTNINTGTGIYSDWYLPSRDELYILYLNKDTIGGFAADCYWSSTQFDQFNAWFVYFGDGGYGIRNTDHTHSVRAVRFF